MSLKARRSPPCLARSYPGPARTQGPVFVTQLRLAHRHTATPRLAARRRSYSSPSLVPPSRPTLTGSLPLSSVNKTTASCSTNLGAVNARSVFFIYIIEVVREREKSLPILVFSRVGKTINLTSYFWEEG